MGNLVYTNFFIQLISFGILFYLLQRYAFKPLFGVMERRRQLVKEQVENAENSRREAERLLEEQKQALQQARKEAYDMIEQAKLTGARQAEEILRAAREEAERLKAEAIRDIEREKEKALAALKAEIGGLSVRIAEKIIERQIDEQAQKDLVERYLQEVGNRS
ncbi:MAG TPA: F0F1 ATP synthase subunit B [Paenibacillaceae bacterium]